MNATSVSLSHGTTELLVVAANLNSEHSINLAQLTGVVKPIFEQLAPHLQRQRQVLYIRDIPAYTIQNKIPGGNAYTPEEATIALPAWEDFTETQRTLLRAAVAHELHHLARWQQVGYGSTLGGAIASEGLATLYEESVSEWKPPWSKGSISSDAWREIKSHWNRKDYSHKQWFHSGNQLGYLAGYLLAKRFFTQGFDLATSCKLADKEFYVIIP